MTLALVALAKTVVALSNIRMPYSLVALVELLFTSNEISSITVPFLTADVLLVDVVLFWL